MGHSNRSVEEFARLIRMYGISTIVDLRRWPRSRRHPHFNSDQLSSLLKGLEVSYVWLGEQLGGYREGGYEEYMKTQAFREGIKTLINLINSRKPYVAIMCSEKLWFRCHRRFVADALVEAGYEVVHIIDESRAVRHKRKVSAPNDLADST